MMSSLCLLAIRIYTENKYFEIFKIMEFLARIFIKNECCCRTYCFCFKNSSRKYNSYLLSKTSLSFSGKDKGKEAWFGKLSQVFIVRSRTLEKILQIADEFKSILHQIEVYLENTSTLKTTCLLCVKNVYGSIDRTEKDGDLYI